jgi:hypothetical protein
VWQSDSTADASDFRRAIFSLRLPHTLVSATAFITSRPEPAASTALHDLMEEIWVRQVLVDLLELAERNCGRRSAVVLPGGSVCSLRQAPDLTLLGSWRHHSRLTRCARTPTPSSSLSAFPLGPVTTMAPLKLLGTFIARNRLQLHHHHHHYGTGLSPPGDMCSLSTADREAIPARRSRRCCSSRGQSPGSVQPRVERCDEPRVPPHPEQPSEVPRSCD